MNTIRLWILKHRLFLIMNLLRDAHFFFVNLITLGSSHTRKNRVRLAW